MKNVKVKGVLDETGAKNFMITNTDTGEVHVAMRDGQKFTLGEFKGTLAQCKQLVSEGRVVHFADSPEEKKKLGTWDCVDPCALLILVAAGADVSPAEIDKTLDAYGWLVPDGQHDALAARENYEKWSK